MERHEAEYSTGQQDTQSQNENAESTENDNLNLVDNNGIAIYSCKSDLLNQIPGQSQRFESGNDNERKFAQEKDERHEPNENRMEANNQATICAMRNHNQANQCNK